MLKLLKQTYSEFSKDNCSRMAAALAYYTTFSLAPMLMLVIMLCGFVWDPSDVEGLVKSEIESVVGRDGAEQVQTMLSSAAANDRGAIGSVISVVMLLVGATGLVGQLQGALNDAWNVQPDPEQGGVWTFISKRILSFGMICGIAFLMLVSLMISAVLTSAGDWIAGWLPGGTSQAMLLAINTVFTVLVVTAMFAVMFRYLPDADIAWSDVVVGAAITAILFVIGKFAMGAYLGSKNVESAYGAAGSLALILLWIYYSAMILLFGAEFTQVWAKERGSGVRPSPGAVQIEERPVVVDRTPVRRNRHRDSVHEERLSVSGRS